MTPEEIGITVGVALSLLGSFVTWWRTYGPRWRPVTNGSKALSTRLAEAEAELAKCVEDREELRELVTTAVIERLEQSGRLGGTS